MMKRTAASPEPGPSSSPNSDIATMLMGTVASTEAKVGRTRSAEPSRSSCEGVVLLEADDDL